MNEIPTNRFHLLAGYNLSAGISVTEEGSCFELADELAIGVIFKDPTTNLFGCVGLVRNSQGLYQKTHEITGLSKYADIVQVLSTALESLVVAGEPVATSHAMDLLTPIVPEEKQSISFKLIRSKPQWAPLRIVLPHLLQSFEDVDNNFVEQFQTTAFDARLWELYLHMALVEDGQVLDRTKNRPDYICTSSGGFLIEAVTVQPTVRDGANVETGFPSNLNELKDYMRQYIPIKFGSPLFSKTRYYHEKYSKLPHVQNKPFAIAIQDFHIKGSMSFTVGYIASYLYGLEHTPLYDKSGNLSIEAEKLVDHTWGNKQIPSGFFNQPGSEVISAVIVNADGTINKFNRLAYSAGFGRDGIVKVERDVFVWDQDSNASEPKELTLDVGASNYFECWGEGVNVFHNPNALHVFPSDVFRFGAHHYLKGDQWTSPCLEDSNFEKIAP